MSATEQATTAKPLRSYVVAKMAVRLTPYLAKEPTDSKASPFQWTKDRRGNARRWPSVKLARLTIEQEAPGWMADVKSFGRPVRFFRVHRIGRKAAWQPGTLHNCTFLGNINGHDLYHHNPTWEGFVPMLLVRYGDGEMAYAITDAADAHKATRLYAADFHIAYKLAVKRGLIVNTAAKPSAPAPAEEIE